MKLGGTTTVYRDRELLLLLLRDLLGLLLCIRHLAQLRLLIVC